MLDTEEVTGSNPVSPTIDERPLTCGNADQGLFSFGREWADSDPAHRRHSRQQPNRHIGSNENINGLLRQHLPKRIDFRT